VETDQSHHLSVVRDITSGAKVGIAVLLVLVLLIGAGNLYATYNAVNTFKAQQKQSGQVVENKICTTLARLAALKPPADASAANPSRVYDVQLHDVLAGLGPDLSCPGK
jgi:hypothetical protein